MEDTAAGLQETPSKPRQPSKLDDHPLIPLADFEDRMREVLSITPEEVERREAEYQRDKAKNAQKRRNPSL